MQVDYFETDSLVNKVVVGVAVAVFVAAAAAIALAVDSNSAGKRKEGRHKAVHCLIQEGKVMDCSLLGNIATGSLLQLTNKKSQQDSAREQLFTFSRESKLFRCTKGQVNFCYVELILPCHRSRYWLVVISLHASVYVLRLL